MTFIVGMLKLSFFLCTDINECLNQDICGPGNTCINTEGSYTCACHKPGYYYVRQEKNCVGKSTSECCSYHTLPSLSVTPDTIILYT